MILKNIWPIFTGVILVFTVRSTFPAPRRRLLHRFAPALCSLATAPISPALFAAKNPPMRVLTPAEALAAFQVEPGLRIELVAAEPLVDDPVACLRQPPAATRRP